MQSPPLVGSAPIPGALQLLSASLYEIGKASTQLVRKGWENAASQIASFFRWVLDRRWTAPVRQILSSGVTRQRLGYVGDRQRSMQECQDYAGLKSSQLERPNVHTREDVSCCLAQHMLEASAGFVFHHANAYEAAQDGSTITIDCVRYPWMPNFEQVSAIYHVSSLSITIHTILLVGFPVTHVHVKHE